MELSASRHSPGYRSTVYGLSLLLLLFLVRTSCATGASGRVHPADLDSLDQFIKHTARCRKLPGLAISLVKGDRVVFSRGYGHADVERGTKAGEHTRFCIGSLTKAFTTTLIADILAKHKNLTWDTPIREVLGSSFRLSDELRTAHVTMRDLLSHKVGTPSNFHPLLVGFPAQMTREQLVRILQYMPAVSDFRTKFHYSNYMYMLAGHVAEVITGEPWENMVTERLLRPLGMRDTGFVDKLESLDEIAVPYVLKNGSLVPVDKELLLSVYPFGPAGSIYSTASDMAKWMQFHLREGESHGGRLLVEPAWLKEVYRSQMAHPFPDRDLVKPRYPVADTSVSYNMGWMSSVYRGYRKLWHSGGIVTFTSHLWLFPDLHAGVFLTSSGTISPHSTAATKSIMSRASDLLLGETPWLNLTTTCTYPSPWRPEKTFTSASDSLPRFRYISTPLTTYEGVYGHRGFGNMTVAVENTDQLYLHYGRFGKMRLFPKDETLFVGKYTDKLWFFTNSDSNTDNIKMEFVFSITNSSNVEGLLFPVDFEQQKTLFTREGLTDPLQKSSDTGSYTSIACGSGPLANKAHLHHSLLKEIVSLLFLHLIITLVIL